MEGAQGSEDSPPPPVQTGPIWALKYPYCHQMITQTHPRGDRRV